MKSMVSTSVAVRSVACAVLLTLTAPSLSAFADVTPPPVTGDSFKASMDQFKKDRDAYVAILKDREVKIRTINATFKSALDKASTDFKAAMATAATPEQKSAARASYLAARTAAINSRDIAINALGSLPTPPVEPVRPMKSKQDKPEKPDKGQQNQKGKN